MAHQGRFHSCFAHRLAWLLMALPLAAASGGLLTDEANAANIVKVRVGSYNTSLHRNEDGKLVEDLQAGSQQARDVAEVLQRVRPDIVLLNEFDYDSQGKSKTLFQTNYLAKPQSPELKPLALPYSLALPVNTGTPSGEDLNNDGKVGGPTDAFGFGRHPGQYGMLVLSRFPIDTDKVRTFQTFLWKDMPKARLPTVDGKPYYSKTQLAVFRLSSKSHWDVPVKFMGRTVHLLVSHPTPPVFDGAEDRNGRRNFDEIRLWADYITGGDSAAYLKDDQGRSGGLDDGQEREDGRRRPPASFVVLGDLNADPERGDSREGAIQQLLKHPRVNSDVTPKSKAEADRTADFGRSGLYRVDYVLPSKDLDVVGAAVYWPASPAPGSTAIKASDHRPVWIDIIW